MVVLWVVSRFVISQEEIVKTQFSNADPLSMMIYANSVHAARIEFEKRALRQRKQTNVIDVRALEGMFVGSYAVTYEGDEVK